jgi:hypothetical protein
MTDGAHIGIFGGARLREWPRSPAIDAAGRCPAGQPVAPAHDESVDAGRQPTHRGREDDQPHDPSPSPTNL